MNLAGGRETARVVAEVSGYNLAGNIWHEVGAMGQLVGEAVMLNLGHRVMVARQGSIATSMNH